MTVADFLISLSPTNIYQGGMDFSLFIATTISPVILVIALWMRVVKMQVETITGNGKWNIFIKDVGIWVFILGSYFALANIITALFNTLYEHFQTVGSYGKTMAHFAEALELNDVSGEESDFSFTSLMSGPMTAVSFVFYYFSFLVVSLVTKFLALAHAMVFSFAIAWGLIAIPLSISGTLSLLKGWGIMLGTVLLWPIIHYSAYAFFDPVFADALSSFSLRDFQKTDRSQLYMIMTIINALSFAITLSAPFIAQALASNSGSIAGVVAPFATAAVATAGMMATQASSALKTAGGAGKAGASKLGKEIFSRLSSPGSGSGNTSPVSENTGTGNSTAGNNTGSSASGGNAPVSESGGTGAGNSASSTTTSDSGAGNNTGSSASGGNAPVSDSGGTGAGNSASSTTTSDSGAGNNTGSSTSGGNSASSSGDSSPAKSGKSNTSDASNSNARKTALKGAALQAAISGPVAEGTPTNDSQGTETENKSDSDADKKKKSAQQARRGAILNQMKGGKL